MQRRLNQKLSAELHSRSPNSNTNTEARRRSSRSGSTSESSDLRHRKRDHQRRSDQEEQRQREIEERDLELQHDLEIDLEHDPEDDHDLHDEEDIPRIFSQLPEYEEDYGGNIQPQERRRSPSPSRGSRSSLGRPRSPVIGSRNSTAEFQNNRLGAFLPGSSTIPDQTSYQTARSSSSINKSLQSKSKSKESARAFDFEQSDREPQLNPREGRGFALVEDEDQENQDFDLDENDHDEPRARSIANGSSGRSNVNRSILPEVVDDDTFGNNEEDEQDLHDVDNLESENQEALENIIATTRNSSRSASPRRNRSSNLKLAPQPPLKKRSSSKSSTKVGKKQSKSKEDRLGGREETPSISFFGSKKQSKSKLSSSSNNNLGRKSSTRKYSKVAIDQFDPPSNINSVSSFVNPLGLAGSSTKFIPPLQPQNSYAVASGGGGSRSRLSRGGSAYGSRIASREVMALPIEIPENVTDEDAFRRYLSVRRGANTDIRPQIDFEDFDEQPSYESVGGGGPSRLPAAMAMNDYQIGMQNNAARTSTLSYAIMTLALLSASASQLRFLVRYSKAHSYPVLNYFLICICIIIEIIVGVGYVILSRFNFSEGRVELIQSYLIAGLFFVAIANVIIAAFAFDDHVCEILAKQTLQQSQSQNQPDIFDNIDQ